MAGRAKTPEEKAAKRAKLDAERAAKKEAAAEERRERRRKEALKSKLPADVAAMDCAPPVESPLPAVAASALPAVCPETLPAAPAVQAVEVVEESRVEKGRRKIEGFLNDCIDSPDLNVRDKLLAAQQLSRVLGLEKQEIKVEVSAAEQWVKAAREQASSGSARMPWEH
ncbi:MAG: hypothetical protein Q4C88_05930 [Akkermansia sp.]|nr:hypothetical protein [Akkermansia sp.]